jgi:hypothetical protein
LVEPGGTCTGRKSAFYWSSCRLPGLPEKQTFFHIITANTHENTTEWTRNQCYHMGLEREK